VDPSAAGDAAHRDRRDGVVLALHGSAVDLRVCLAVFRAVTTPPSIATRDHACYIPWLGRNGSTGAYPQVPPSQPAELPVMMMSNQLFLFVKPRVHQSDLPGRLADVSCCPFWDRTVGAARLGAQRRRSLCPEEERYRTPICRREKGGVPRPSSLLPSHLPLSRSPGSAPGIQPNLSLDHSLIRPNSCLAVYAVARVTAN